jgi:TRAP transporter TAXI family solute receptor
LIQVKADAGSGDGTERIAKKMLREEFMKALARLMATGVVAASFLAAPAHAEMKSITIGTNPSGSVFYLLGGGFAKLFQEKLGIRSTAQPQGGSSVYLPMVNSGEMTLGISSNIDAGMAYRGAKAYPAAMTDLRALGRVWLLPYAYITTAESGIVKMEDLKGKRVMGNMPTNVALTEINTAMLKSGGLSLDDVQFERSGGLIDGIQAVVQGRADAAPVATSMPILVESNSSVPGGLRIIANGAQASDAFYAGEVPGTRTAVVKPSERYPFIIGDTEIIAYDTLVVTSTAQSDDDVYQLVKTMHENWKQLQKDYPPMRSVSEDAFAMVDPTVPYHPGAVRYFKEVGMWSDAHEAHQAAFK